MIMKRIEKEQVSNLINLGASVLVASSYNEQKTLATVAWSMSAGIGLVALSLKNDLFITELIKNSQEFTINFPSTEIKESVLLAGSISGRAQDKFIACNLESEDGKLVNSPIVSQCFAHIECKLKDIVVIGDYSLVIGEVVLAYAKETAISEQGILQLDQETPLIYLGGENAFATLIND